MNFFDLRFDIDLAQTIQNSSQTHQKAKVPFTDGNNIDIFFDFSIMQSLNIANTRSIWVAPVDLRLGLGGLNIYLRHIASIKLKVEL